MLILFVIRADLIDQFAFYGFTPEVVLSNPEYIKTMFQTSNERGTDVVKPIIETAGSMLLFFSTISN